MADFIDADLRGSRLERVDLAGAQLRAVDLAGAQFRGVDLSGTVMRGVELVDVDIYGEIENLIINGVDIGPLVEAELNRRYPDRARMRPSDPAGFREAWDILGRLWDQTVERARRLPSELLHGSVGGEWSFIETLRHLAFATDAWIRPVSAAPPLTGMSVPVAQLEPVPGTATMPVADPFPGRQGRTARFRQPGDSPGPEHALGDARWQTAAVTAGLRAHEGGSGEPLLVLLHGLGATSDVWDGWRPWLARRWPGRWLAPDLPGHGGSPPLAAYTFDGFAAAVAGLLRPATNVVVLGHSLGGVVALTLASDRFAAGVQAVIGLGIKVAWSDEDLARAQDVARRPPAWFASRDEAAARYLRVSGLNGVAPADDPAVDAGLRERDGQWRLAMDPGAFTVGAPDMAGLLARSQAPVTLARGERDPMNTDEQLARLGVPTVTLPGLGHNAHVESPELSMALLDRYR